MIAALLTAAVITSQAPATNRANAASPGNPQYQLGTGSAGAQSDSCGLPSGAGYGNVMYGANIFWSKADPTCQHLRVFYALQPRHPDVADGVLCEIPFVREAAKNKGSDLCLTISPLPR